jgi:predicted XRE-type DNA-binding protein
MTKRKNQPHKNPHVGSRFDDFMKEQGLYDDAKSTAIKEVIVWQIAEQMKQQGISKIKMATMMKTSRSQLDRLLNPVDDNVTLATLEKAAAMLGRKLRLELA